MEPLETVTRQEAAKLFLNDVGGNLVYTVGCIFGSNLGYTGSVMLIRNHTSLGRAAFAVGSVLLGVGMCLVKRSYSRIKEYVESPGNYVLRRHHGQLVDVDADLMLIPKLRSGDFIKVQTG